MCVGGDAKQLSLVLCVCIVVTFLHVYRLSSSVDIYVYVMRFMQSVGFFKKAIESASHYLLIPAEHAHTLQTHTCGMLSRIEWALGNQLN